MDQRANDGNLSVKRVVPELQKAPRKAESILTRSASEEIDVNLLASASG